MTPLFPAQRAAEEFDQVLGGTADQALADRYAELLDTVTVLRAHPEVTPRADFVVELRSRLMTAAGTDLVTAPAVVRQLPTERPSRNRRRLGTIAASLVIVGGTAGMAAAASGSLPGEALYPIKRGVEQVNAAIRFDDASKGEVLLDQAAERLDEVRELQEQGDPAPELVASTVDSFRTAAQEGSDKLFEAYETDGGGEQITTVRTFTEQEMGTVDGLTEKAMADGVLLDVADTLADIDQQARVLCAACGPEDAVVPPGALALGAATVSNLLTRPVTQAEADIQRVEAARVAKLKAQAERNAGLIPQVPANPGPGATSGVPSLTDPEAPLTSTITEDGRQVPPVTAGATTKKVLNGTTAGVNQLVETLIPGESPLKDGVKDLTDTVDKTVDGLLPGQ